MPALHDRIMAAARPESLLIHGNDPRLTSAFAVGLAARFPGGFVWADCGAASSRGAGELGGVYGRGTELADFDPEDDALFEPPLWARNDLSQLLQPLAPKEDERLTAFLALPEFFQRALVLCQGTKGAILLTDVDAGNEGPRTRLLQSHALHRSLQRQGVGLIATCRRDPPGRLSQAFDRVFRVHRPPRGGWREALVAVERGEGPGSAATVWTLHDAWDLLGLDPSLFPY